MVGPTASGKTTAAIEFARYYQTEIISFDSRQFYREMNIGTAKPTPFELSSAPHHFIGQLSVTENYTAGKYANDADALLQELFKHHDVVIAVGGSGLFLKAWTEGLDELPHANENIRTDLQSVFERNGVEALQRMLKERDPVYHAQVDLNNPRRLIRALEVCIASNKPYSSFLTQAAKPLNYRVTKIGLNPQRDDLYSRINARVDAMVGNGLVDEVKSLVGYRNLKPLHTVGYGELFEYFDGKIDLRTAIENIKQHTRNYAKRQLTWFKKDMSILWMERFELAQVLKALDQ